MVKWYWIPVTFVLAIVLAYIFHSALKAALRRLESRFVKPHLMDIQARLKVITDMAEVDVARVKSEVVRLADDVKVRLGRLV